ncbi:MAG: TetR/AcrR family transcriptional regulator [Paracoccaceae bacterium]
MIRPTPILHRDDPSKAPLTGHIKVTRNDWINVARDILVTDGVAGVKVLAIGERLGVSRSSFYWYFKSRKHLLEELLSDWESRNTACIVTACSQSARSIGQACCHFFRCFIDPDLFDQGLDFAVREWARRDGPVRTRVNAADATRLEALTAMFARHDYAMAEADTRARVLYFMQLGYHALDQQEPMTTRMARLPLYLETFTGRVPDPEDYAAHNIFTSQALSRTKDTP